MNTLWEAPLSFEAHDPFAQEDHPRPFAVGYRKGTGEGPVYGGVVAALLAGFVAAYSAEPGYYLVTLACLALAFYFFPLVETGRPQLGANGDGFFVAGIGFIAWAEIEGFELFNSAVRQIRLSTLIVTLHRPLQDVVTRPEKVPWWRALMTRAYRLKGGTRLEVPLHPMVGSPEEILRRLKAYRA